MTYSCRLIPLISAVSESRLLLLGDEGVNWGELQGSL